MTISECYFWCDCSTAYSSIDQQVSLLDFEHRAYTASCYTTYSLVYTVKIILEVDLTLSIVHILHHVIPHTL